MGGEGQDSDQAETDSHEQQEEIPPLGHFVVGRHKPVVDITVRVLGVLVADQGLETTDDIIAVVDVRITNRRRVDSEEASVKEGIGGGQIEGAVGFVCSLVEKAISIENSGNIVSFPEAIEWRVRVDLK